MLNNFRNSQSQFVKIIYGFKEKRATRNFLFRETEYFGGRVIGLPIEAFYEGQKPENLGLSSRVSGHSQFLRIIFMQIFG